MTWLELLYCTVCEAMLQCSGVCAAVLQVELKEYVKLRDSIYDVEPNEEHCLRFSRVLNFKVGVVCFREMSVRLLCDKTPFSPSVVVCPFPPTS